MAGRIAAPISALEHGVTEVSRGDLDAKIDESAPTVEIRNLATSFNRMTADLRSHVERLAEEEAELKRMEHDLDIARQIQQGLLPTSKPDLPGYDISGWSRSANKTGGDYYDWQTLAGRSTAGVAGRCVGAWDRPGAGGGRVPGVCAGERGVERRESRQHHRSPQRAVDGRHAGRAVRHVRRHPARSARSIGRR